MIDIANIKAAMLKKRADSSIGRTASCLVP